MARETVYEYALYPKGGSLASAVRIVFTGNELQRPELVPTHEDVCHQMWRKMQDGTVQQFVAEGITLPQITKALVSYQLGAYMDWPAAFKAVPNFMSIDSPQHEAL